MNRWLVGMVMATALIQAAGCSEVSVSGKTAKDVFQDPQTLALVEAACHGDIPKIDALVKQGANVNATGYEDTSVLAWTMQCRNYKGIERLLDLGANPNYKMDGGDSPTWLAAGSSDHHFLPLMLEHGGNPNIWSGADSALMLAMEQDRKKNFEYLIDHGADINDHDSVGNTVATYAAALAKFDVVIMLLKRGYNYDLQRLALGINGRVVPAHSELSIQKEQILAILKERGVKFPLPPPGIEPPPPGIK